MINRKSLVLGLTLLILVMAVAILGWGIIRKTQLDSSSASFSTDTMQALFSANGADTLGEIVASGSFSAESQEGLVVRMTHLKRLVGSLESIDGIFGGAEVPLLPFQEVTAAYDLNLLTRAGNINAALILLWVDNKWIVQGLSFSGSPLQN